MRQPGPIQLDLFELRQREFECKVIITNKSQQARAVVDFHKGRGQQENVFAELKSQGALSYLPCKRWIGNKIYLLCNVLAHNFTRRIQMELKAVQRPTNSGRSPLWILEKMETLRRTMIQRAGRLTSTNGILTLTMSANKVVQQKIERFMVN